MKNLSCLLVAMIALFPPSLMAIESGDKLVIKKPIATDKNNGVADFLNGKQFSLTNSAKNKEKISCRIAVLNGPRGDILMPQELEFSAAENDLDSSRDNHFALKGYKRPLSIHCWKIGKFEIVRPTANIIKATMGGFVSIKKH